MGSIPGVIIGTKLAVKAPQALLRNALGIVLCASSATLLLKQKPPASVLIPSFIVASLFVAGLVLFQLNLHRKAVRRRERLAAATP